MLTEMLLFKPEQFKGEFRKPMKWINSKREKRRPADEGKNDRSQKRTEGHSL